jgi:hypothetical protein
MTDKPYWVEADVAVKDYSRVISYSVRTGGGAGERVKSFRISKRCGCAVALSLANQLRDDLNAGLALDAEPVVRR